MGCGCGAGASGAAGADEAAARAQQGAVMPSVAYVSVPAQGDVKVFARGTTAENHTAAQLHAAANGGGWVRLASGDEALTGELSDRGAQLPAVDNVEAA